MHASPSQSVGHQPRVAARRRVPALARVAMLARAVVCAIACAVVASPARAGAQAAADSAASRLKIGASTLLGIPMVGVERPLARAKRSFQWDVMLSPWRSVDGFPLQLLVGTAEWRFYRRESRTGWYAALNTGGALFRLRKPEYADTTLYQEGAGLFAGGSIGYVMTLRSGLTLDAYVGGGSTQSLYKGYDRLTGSRYDGARLWNVSGEALPYRIGLSVGLPRH